jgi:crotonobetainyl-CoA:carnitine CoA-transferase CaiB-like acyl-CoA transferase
MLNGGGLYDVYASRDGRWFAMGALEPQFLSALFKALGLGDAALPPTDATYISAQLKPRIAAAFAQRDYAEWIEIFSKVDACVEPVLGLDEAIAHPQLVAREMVIEVPGPDGRPMRQPGCVIKFSRPLPAPAFCGVASGAHSDEILAELKNQD